MSGVSISASRVGLNGPAEEEIAGLDVLEHGSPGYGEGFGSYVPGAIGDGGTPAPPAKVPTPA